MTAADDQFDAMLATMPDVVSAPPLLPCPFCGGAGTLAKCHLERLQQPPVAAWYPGCDECRYTLAMFREDDVPDAHLQAIALWNRRASAPPPTKFSTLASKFLRQQRSWTIEQRAAVADFALYLDARK